MPKEKPRVSVIVIFYNTGIEFLREAVDSVYRQTYPDWELLLVDDGTTDGTDALAREYADEDPERVRYVHHVNRVNRGMSATRNLGIANARGEFIALLDADDVWLPTILEDQVSILDREPDAEMVYGPVERWYTWSEGNDKKDFIAYPLETYDHVIQPPGLLNTILTNRQGAPLGVLCRAHAIRRVGGYEERFRGMCEDLAFFSKFCLVHPVYASSKCWYRYRQHDSSAVHKSLREGTRNAARITFYWWYIRHVVRKRRMVGLGAAARQVFNLNRKRIVKAWKSISE